MEKSGAKAYLVNTGWNGTGKRISIKDTRGIIDAILKRSNLTMHRPRRSRTSTSRFRPSFRVLIRQSLTRVIPTLMLPSGRQRQRILLPDSLRTSLNTKATQLVRLWLLQVRRLNSNQTIRRIDYERQAAFADCREDLMAA